MFQDKGKLVPYYYQGSEISTSEEIEELYKKSLNNQKINIGKNNIILAFFDQMGLAERSNNNPLKILNFLLERDIYFELETRCRKNE